MNKVHTFGIAIDWKMIADISSIDRFDASWSSIEKKEGQSLTQLKSIATVRSVGASTRIEGSMMSDPEVEVLLQNMNSYNSYHTSIKQLARSNNLPNKYVKCIDRSTIWRWKQEKEDKYLGHELSNIQVLQQFLERRESETLIRSYLKIALSLSAIINKTS